MTPERSEGNRDSLKLTRRKDGTSVSGAPNRSSAASVRPVLNASNRPSVPGGASRTPDSPRAPETSKKPNAPKSAKSTDKRPTVSPFAFPIVAATRLCVRRPVAVLIFALALAALSLWFASVELQMKTSRLDLINPKSEFNKRWLDYVADFGDEDDLVVVVEGKSETEIAPALDAVAFEVARRPKLFKSVFSGVEQTNLARKGLYFLPDDRLREIAETSEIADAITAGRREASTAEAFLTGFARRLDSPEHIRTTFESARPFASALAFAFGDRFDPTAVDSFPSPVPNAPELDSILAGSAVRRLVSDDGTIGVVNLELVEGKEGSFEYGTTAIDKLREIIADVRTRFPDVEIGLTGLTVMENDEMRASRETSVASGIIAFIGVTLVFIATFGGVKRPLIAVFALAVGFAWTTGFIALSVGGLNILSMSFGVILIGLGIDFGIHYVARYSAVRETNRSVGESILETAASVGPGIFAGAATTAAAFGVIGFSEFTGIAELGIISAGGVLLCCFATLLVVPATLRLVDGGRPFQNVSAPVNVCEFVAPLYRFPKTLLVAVLVPTVVLGWGVSKLRYDHNLLNMQAENLESVEYERKLFERWDKGAWFAISLCDSREQLLERKAKFDADPTLRTDEIATVLPDATPEKQATIERIAAALAPLTPTVEPIPVAGPEALGATIAAFVDAASRVAVPETLVDVRTEISTNLADVAQRIAALPADEYAARIDAFQRRLAVETTKRLLAIRAVATPVPPSLADLPAELTERYVGAKTGRLALRVYSTEDVWDMPKLKPFVEKIRAVDPEATGNPIQTYESSLQMERSYFVSGIWAFGVVFAFVLFEFKSLKYTIVALIPTFLGSLQAFGLLGWLGIPLNAANSIVVPLILGLGVDDGIHLTHSIRESRGREYNLTSSLASSVVLTTLTTAIGFGSLMIADHRGLQSLGRVLTIGVSACMFTSLLVLPAGAKAFRRLKQ